MAENGGGGTQEQSQESGATVSGFQGQGDKPVAQSTQTPAGGSEADAAKNGQPEAGKTDGTGESTEGEGSGDGNGADAPDADGKYTHPDSKEKVDASTMVDYYRTKFGESTKGANDLLTKNSGLTSKNTELEGTVATLTKEIEQLRTVAEGKNPEGLKLVDLQAQLTKTSEELALVKESGALDAFEKEVPLATGQYRESLKALARANPKSSLKELWDANLKSGAEAAANAAKAAKESRDKGAGDKGKGTSTREHTASGDTVKGSKGDTGLTLEAFNALPVKERRDLIVKYDIR